MSVYLAIYVLLAVAAYLAFSSKQSNVLAVVFGIFLVLFIGTRFQVGCDWWAYTLRFNSLYADIEGWAEGFRLGEGGFHLINLVAYDAGWGFNGVVLPAAIIYISALVRFSYLAPHPASLIAIAFPILIIQLGMSGMRQALATAMLMLACVAFVKGKKFVTGGWIGLASQFHTSSIAFLPIAALARTNISTKYVIGAVVLLSPLAGWLLGERLEVYSDRYIEQIYGENASGGAWIRYAIASLPFVVMAWKRNRVAMRYPELYPLLKLFGLMCLGLLGAGLVSSVALHRLVYYVLPVSLLCLLCVSDAAFSSGSRRFARALPFLIYGVYIVTWFVFSRHATSCYVPYNSWLL
ncbi:EpsG family protein [Flagellatimonas centrodinii]|uniref:EpsG family protein n=1 Tax=Flagellatimonas centrodinii TaxID=2806210 RepID=UPI001FFA246C|nr:EpsG family protein [Flagellatimonas centrodinii]ULQ46698.1 EpsG family protein [Flagellatimonas centrodinii]